MCHAVGDKLADCFKHNQAAANWDTSFSIFEDEDEN